MRPPRPLPSDAGSRLMDTPGRRRDSVVGFQTTMRKLASRPWPIIDDEKHRCDEFKARTVNMALRARYGEDEIAQALHNVLHGDAVIYLDRLHVGEMSLDDIIWHLDLLYKKRTTDPEMAQAALEVVTGGETEPANWFGKCVLILASAATVEGKRLDLKAQRAFVGGINCSVTAPHLRKARMKKDCTMESLLRLAEQIECHYQLKRVDPTDNQTAPEEKASESGGGGRGGTLTPGTPPSDVLRLWQGMTLPGDCPDERSPKRRIGTRRGSAGRKAVTGKTIVTLKEMKRRQRLPAQRGKRRHLSQNVTGRRRSTVRHPRSPRGSSPRRVKLWKSVLFNG